MSFASGSFSRDPYGVDRKADEDDLPLSSGSYLDWILSKVSIRSARESMRGMFKKLESSLQHLGNEAWDLNGSTLFRELEFSTISSTLFRWVVNEKFEPELLQFANQYVMLLALERMKERVAKEMATFFNADSRILGTGRLVASVRRLSGCLQAL